ncbi:MAG: DUF4864 domain-containing protein [Armatimonadetes bacterium]|nr:DUF4864 domain-containing protein [Armatimonadota bacterium]
MKSPSNSRVLTKFAVAGVVLLLGALGLSGFFAPSSDPTLAQNAPPQWKTATPTQRSAGGAAIRSQLDAFKKGQWDKAVSFQSATLQRNFASTAAFRAMMERTYPQFIRFKTVSFGPARAAGPYVQIAVKLTGSDGATTDAIYTLVKEKAGYRVDGVSGGAVPPPAPTAPLRPEKPAETV